MVVADFNVAGFWRRFDPVENDPPLAVDAEAPDVGVAADMQLLCVKAGDVPEEIDVFALIEHDQLAVCPCLDISGKLFG